MKSYYMLNVIKGFTQMNQKNSLQYNAYAKNLGTMHKYNILCLSLAYLPDRKIINKI